MRSRMADLTISEGARLARISRQAVARAIAVGQIKAVRVGPIWTITRAAARAFVAYREARRMRLLKAAKLRAVKASARARELRR